MDSPQASAEATADLARQLALLVRQLDGLGQLDEAVLTLLSRLPRQPAAIWSALEGSALAPALQAALPPAGDAAPTAAVASPEMIYAAAIRLAVCGALCPTSSAGEAVWQHSLRVAALSQLAAEQLAGRSSSASAPLAAFSAGLLHDVGKLALAQCLPKSFMRLARPPWAQMEAIQAERQLLAADHATVGRRLARHWRLPGYIRQAVWLHHQLPEAIPAQLESAHLVRIVRWADRAVRDGEGLPAFTAAQVADATEQLGLSEAGLSRIARLFPERMRQLAKQVPAAMPPEASAGSAAADADADTQKSPETLSQVAHLAERLRPEDSLSRVCQVVAEAFFATVENGISAVGSFAVAGRNLTLALSELGGTEIHSLPCLPNPAWPSAAGSPMPARKLLRRLLSEADGHAVGCPGGLMCVPLNVDQRLVGGILLPKGQSEPGPLEALGPLVRLARFAIAAVVERAEADEMVERLALASQHLAGTRKALAQAQALAAVGEMAAGAAHEMNNPLAVISGRAQMLAGSAADPADRKTAELIARKAQDLSDLITEMMAFARPAEPSPRAIDPFELFKTVQARLAEQDAEAAQSGQDSSAQPKPAYRPADIRVQVSSPSAADGVWEAHQCPPLYADRGQLEEILMELVRNAATASQGRASVCFEASADPAGGAVLLAVRDDGPGMDEATLASAFTPFFSSRPAGRGRGMGLARARRAVEANGGSMRIDSRPGQGATVFLRLPQASREQS
jgi:signal transduction histidine kinase